MSSQKQLTQLEREYFVRKLGGATQIRPFNDLKREYLISQIGAVSPSESTVSLEKKWLRDLIGGATGTTEAELWAEAVIAEGGEATKFINQNKRIFFEIAS